MAPVADEDARPDAYAIEHGDRCSPPSPIGNASQDVDDLAVPAETATVGERAAIEATLANDGEQVAAVEVVLTVDGNVSTVQSVEVPAGESRTVTFERAFGSPGEYAVAVQNVSGTVAVVEAEQNESTAVDSGSENREDGGFGELLLLGSVGVLALVGAILGLSRWMEP